MSGARAILRAVRLATCLALELATTVSFAAAIAGGIWYVKHPAVAPHAAAHVEPHASIAPTLPALPSPIVAPPAPDAAALELDPPEAPSAAPTASAPATEALSVFGAADETLLAPLRLHDLVRVKINHGGTSLSLRLDFASGAKAAFKPRQVHYQSDPRKEIAAYRLDRLLGIGHVPPAIAGGFTRQALLEAAEPQSRNIIAARLAEEGRATNEMFYGELSWWVPELRNATIKTWRIDEDDGIDAWRDMLRPTMPLPAEHAAFVAQISTMILFDYVIDNSDRWSGANTRSSMDGKWLYFMDNTLSFSKFTRGHVRNITYLKRAARFSRTVVAALRALTRAQIAQAMAPRDSEDEALAPLLTDEEIDGVLGRRDYALQWVDELIAKHGEEKVLVFP